jgi:hypothetical protein
VGRDPADNPYNQKEIHMFAGGIAVFVALLMLFLWLPVSLRQSLARFGFFTDISIHIVCQVMLGGDGIGRMSMLFGCVAFNLLLMVYRKTLPKEYS